MDIKDRILSGVKDLPTLPTVYSALSDAMSRPTATAEQIATVISSDQASAFRVLKIVNSAFYGFPGHVDSISRAVVILGFDEIRNLILASSVMDLFSKRDIAMDFRPADFWAHSIAVGLLTKLIGQAAGISAKENLFVSGILHDVGKLALFQFAESEFAQAVTYAAEHNCLIREAEMEIMGMDHATAGLLLAERWHLPPSLMNSIRYHHDGKVSGKPDSLVTAVHLADVIARSLELGYPGDNLVPEPSEHVWQTLRLREGVFGEIVPTLLRQFDDAVGTLLHR